MPENSEITPFKALIDGIAFNAAMALDPEGESIENRRIAEDKVGGYRISTVRLPGSEMLETMVFEDDDWIDYFCHQTYEREEAIAVHCRLMEELGRGDTSSLYSRYSEDEDDE